MPSSTIDALVVTLGLDSKEFNSGLEKAVSSLTGFATKMAGLAIGFEGLAAGIKYFEQLHTKMADLEFAANNLGVLGTQLNKLGELSRLFGGSFDDAKNSVEGLQGAIFNLRFKGEMSEQLMALGRYGIKYEDSPGRSRDEVAVARDVAAAVDRQAARTPGGMDAGQRRQLAQWLLGPGGLANAAATGVEGFAAAWKRAQEDQKGLTEKTLKNNLTAYKDIDVSGRTQREIDRMPVLAAMLPDLEKLNDDLTELTSKAMPYLTDALHKLSDLILHPGKEWEDIEKKLTKIVGKLLEEFQKKLLGVPPEITGGVSGGKFLRNPFAAVVRLEDMTMDSLLKRFDVWMSQFTGLPLSVMPPVPVGTPGALPNVPVPHHHLQHQAPVTPLAPRPPASGSSSSPPTSRNGAPTTNITFENVTVSPRGQDGRAFANDFVDQTRRKFLSAASEGGLA